MKNTFFLFLVMLSVLTTDFCYAQQSEDAIIRGIENTERVAILKGDTAMLLKLWSPKVTVNNPENTVVTFEQIKKRSWKLIARQATIISVS